MADLGALKEQLDGLTLLEAAELVKMLEESWGVSAAAPVAVAAPGAASAGGGAEAAEEEQTEFDVVLTEVGPKKINVIKVVRSITSLGLKEAKEVVEGAPSTILQAVSKENAEDAKAKLEEEGAAVQIK